MLLSVVGLGSLTACTSAASVSGAADYTGTRVAAGTSGGTASLTKPAAAARPDQSVTITGTLTLAAADPIHAASAISDIVSAGGGRIANSTEQPKGAASASLTARIPAGAFDSTLRTIERVGRVTNATMQTTDESSRVTDYVVRSRTLQQSITRLQALLGRASTTTDLIAIENSLESRETDLEELQADQKGLADQISYATLAISINAPSVAVRPKPTTFGGAVVAGFAALVATVAGIVIGLGYALPWLVLVVVLGTVALLIHRLATHRRRAAVTVGMSE